MTLKHGVLSRVTFNYSHDCAVGPIFETLSGGKVVEFIHRACIARTFECAILFYRAYSFIIYV